MFEYVSQSKINITSVMAAESNQSSFIAHKNVIQGNKEVAFTKEHFKTLYTAYQDIASKKKSPFGEWIRDPNSGIYNNQLLNTIENKVTVVQSLHDDVKELLNYCGTVELSRNVIYV